MSTSGGMDQFLLLAKSTTGKALADLITKATAEPGVFGFGELLDLPQVQGLVSTDLAAHVSLLRIFAYGIWRDYTSAQEQLPQLTEVQALKLKQLTVASMARGVDSISYDDITRETGISNLRDLEDFLIGCFYSGVIKGTLDHRNLRVLVESCIGRDVRSDELGNLITRLKRWVDAATATCSQIGDSCARLPFSRSPPRPPPSVEGPRQPFWRQSRDLASPLAADSVASETVEDASRVAARDADLQKALEKKKANALLRAEQMAAGSGALGSAYVDEMDIDAPFPGMGPDSAREARMPKRRR